MYWYTCPPQVVFSSAPANILQSYKRSNTEKKGTYNGVQVKHISALGLSRCI